MDIGGWLRSIGLEQYEAAFRENAIDDAILPRLTAEDLKDLGIGLVGHRRKLLEAIAALPADAHAQPDPANTIPTIDRTPRTSAERRQVTVMFADLVGSTALSSGMDPEDLQQVIGAYQKCVAECVRRFGGFVARYLGDGVLAYFGYPEAHEDDAERAVRAALELVHAVAGLEANSPQKVRVGIATGLVVVGHLIPSGESEIIGETPNVAARLQALAKPNMIVIADGTRRLLGNLFQLQELGMKNLKGIPTSVRSWAVLRPSLVASRFEALRPAGMTALVGRQSEFELMQRCWFKATEGKGQVLLISGEAGIGKSRLAAGFAELLTGEPHIRVRYFCFPQHTDSAFYPIIGQMERAAGLARNDPLKRKLNKLDLLLKQTFSAPQDAALIAEMLSLPNDGRYSGVEQLTAQQRRQRTLDALISQLETLALAHKVLIVFEDAHWSTPQLLELFDRVVDQISALSVLLIITFRPEFKPVWIGRSHVTAVNLNRLAAREVGAMIDQIVGNTVLSASLRQEIIERTDGIPLFVEEMTQALLEAENEDDARRAAALVPSPRLAVPATLHASLMARLDRLGPAKELAQIGAAIGRGFARFTCCGGAQGTDGAGSGARPYRSFWVAASARCAPVCDLLFQACFGTRRSVQHAVARAEARTSCCNRRNSRRPVHRYCRNQPELLARHWTEAGEIEKAAACWGEAGQRSLQRSALVEGAEQLKRAL